MCAGRGSGDMTPEFYPQPAAGRAAMLPRWSCRISRWRFAYTLAIVR
jgi:hypothetical protein